MDTLSLAGARRSVRLFAAGAAVLILQSYTCGTWVVYLVGVADNSIRPNRAFGAAPGALSILRKAVDGDPKFRGSTLDSELNGYTYNWVASNGI